MPRTPLRILCFGDSLTAGYPANHPYGGKLEEKLSAASPHIEPICEVDGEPGNRVAHGSYRRRMERAWGRRSSIGSNGSNSSRPSTGNDTGASDQPLYDWTIVLGGTNDIAWNISPNDVIDGLRRTWGIPLSRGGKVLALTIPEAGRGHYPRSDKARDEINEAIRAYKRPGYYYFDLYSALPYKTMPPAKRSRIWNEDAVHLTEEGYDYMGEKIAEALTRIIRLAEAQDTEISSVVSDARQRRAIEELILEEEMGNPKLLSQGYIVVRKTDLE